MNFNNTRDFFSAIVSAISITVFILSFISVVYGFIKKFQSKDDEKKQKKAKMFIVIGLVFIFLAFMLYGIGQFRICGDCGV